MRADRGRWTAPALAGLVALGIAVQARAAGHYDAAAAMQQALRFHESFDDGRAVALLHELLHHGPPVDIAAKAHLYLGIIALDALRVADAREEFEQAIGIDPTLEPPLTSSPKVGALYRDVRRKLATGPEMRSRAAEPAPPSALPPALSPMPPPELTEPPPEPPSHLPAYVVGGVGLACLATGIVLGVVSNSEASQATSPGPGEYATVAEAAAQTASSERVAADVLFGVALVAGVTSVVLFFTEKAKAPTEPPPPAGTLVPTWNLAPFAAGHF